MSLDGQYRFSRPELVDLLDEFLINTALPDDDILINPEHQPLNPESEDEVPNQEAVNGIARANRPKEPAWRDLGLTELVASFPNEDGPGKMNLGDKLRSLNMAQRSTEPSTAALRTMR